MALVGGSMPDASPGIEEALAGALSRASAYAVKGVEQVSVLYSGGVDSSVVASLLRPLVEVHLVCVATEARNRRGRGAERRRSARASAFVASDHLRSSWRARTNGGGPKPRANPRIFAA